MREAALWPNVLWARIPRGRLRNMIATVAVVTVTVAGAALIPNDTAPTPPPSPSGVDVWIATNGNDSTCVRGNQSFPCLTFNRAYEIAQCGDTVSVASGSYGNVEISATTKSCAGSYVRFEEAEGETVILNRLSCTLTSSYDCTTTPTQWVEVDGFTVLTTVTLNVPSGGTDLNWRVLNIDGGSPQYGATNLYSSGNDWGPCESSGATNAARCSATGGGEQAHIYGQSSNLVIDGDTFHDFLITNPADHWECMYNNGSTGDITIRNSHFYNCATYAIYFTSFNSAHQYDGNYTIENNWFGLACNSICTGTNRNSAINLGGSAPGGPPDNLLFRYNSFAEAQTIVREGGLAGANNRAVGNIFGTSGCVSDVQYSYNAIRGGTCGTGDVNISSMPYVNGDDQEAANYHLSGSDGSTSADNLVSPTSSDYALTTDRDGETRPNDANRDAGSDER